VQERAGRGAHGSIHVVRRRRAQRRTVGVAGAGVEGAQRGHGSGWVGTRDETAGTVSGRRTSPTSGTAAARAPVVGSTQRTILRASMPEREPKGSPSAPRCPARQTSFKALSAQRHHRASWAMSESNAIDPRISVMHLITLAVACRVDTHASGMESAAPTVIRTTVR
jgi:hypothetical protein